MANFIKELFAKNKLPRVEFRPEGRNGYLVYVDESRECTMGFEISGNNEYDILAYTETIKTWSTGKEVSNEEKKEILNSFKQWEESKKYRVQW